MKDPNPVVTGARPFLIARTVDEAVAALAGGARPVAGGTDLVVGSRQGKAPLPDRLVAVDRVPELCSIDVADDGRLLIGAAVTHAELMTDRRILGRAAGLADGAALIGSPATRNVGTLGGNVMNGSPAMDTGAPLAVLGAVVELISASGRRTVPVTDLWSGPGETSARTDELCTAVVLPSPSGRSGSAYVRLEYRRAMEIAVVGAAASVTVDERGVLTSLAVALTAVAPTILVVSDLDDLIGRSVDAEVAATVAARAGAAATPIDDLRAGADYRRHAVGVMAGRALDAAARRADGADVHVPVNRAEGVGARR